MSAIGLGLNRQLDWTTSFRAGQAQQLPINSCFARRLCRWARCDKFDCTGLTL